MFDKYSLKEGVTAVFAAALANATVVAISQNLLETSREFTPLTYGPTVTFTVIGGLMGLVVWEIFKSKRDKPVRDYLLTAAIVTLLSFGPILFTVGEPGAGMVEVIMLSLTHANAAVVFTATLLHSDLEY